MDTKLLEFTMRGNRAWPHAQPIENWGASSIHPVLQSIQIRKILSGKLPRRTGKSPSLIRLTGKSMMSIAISNGYVRLRGVFNMK